MRDREKPFVGQFRMVLIVAVIGEPRVEGRQSGADLRAHFRGAGNVDVERAEQIHAERQGLGEHPPIGERPDLLGDRSGEPHRVVVTGAQLGELPIGVLEPAERTERRVPFRARVVVRRIVL